MTNPAPDYVYHLTSVVGLLLLIVLYFFGVWSRSYVMPTDSDVPLRKQLVASVPIGFMTMGIYAKSAFPAMLASPEHLPFDLAVTIGYAIIFGMLSRESLERLLKTVKSPLPNLVSGPAPPNG
jgi:hypothetical protein